MLLHEILKKFRASALRKFRNFRSKGPPKREISGQRANGKKVAPTRFSREGGQRALRNAVFGVKGPSETRNFGSKGVASAKTFSRSTPRADIFFGRGSESFYTKLNHRDRGVLAASSQPWWCCRAWLGNTVTRDLRIANRAHRPWESELVLGRPSLRTADSILGSGIADPGILGSPPQSPGSQILGPGSRIRTWNSVPGPGSGPQLLRSVPCLGSPDPGSPTIF